MFSTKLKKYQQANPAASKNLKGQLGPPVRHKKIIIHQEGQLGPPRDTKCHHFFMKVSWDPL